MITKISIKNNQPNVVLKPNPASTVVTINYTLLTPTESQITIRDIFGRAVFETKLYNAPSGTTTINISKFTRGVYMVAFETGGNKLVSRLIKE